MHVRRKLFVSILSIFGKQLLCQLKSYLFLPGAEINGAATISIIQ
jgi:hypothetical protein